MTDMKRHCGTTKAFTLMELLVVVAIISLLMSVLLPALGRAKTVARIARAHAELRAITQAMEFYRGENLDQIPPTRLSCNLRTAYDLPVELLPYLPRGRDSDLDIVQMEDPFTPGQCYKYRAAGPAIMNESTLIPNGANLWIPDGFGGDETDAGSYHDDPQTSPVRFAVYSMGPDPASVKFDIPGRLPVPRKYWLTGASDTGVIVHMLDNKGLIHTSP